MTPESVETIDERRRKAAAQVGKRLQHPIVFEGEHARLISSSREQSTAEAMQRNFPGSVIRDYFAGVLKRNPQTGIVTSWEKTKGFSVWTS